MTKYDAEKLTTIQLEVLYKIMFNKEPYMLSREGLINSLLLGKFTKKCKNYIQNETIS